MNSVPTSKAVAVDYTAAVNDYVAALQARDDRQRALAEATTALESAKARLTAAAEAAGLTDFEVPPEPA